MISTDDLFDKTRREIAKHQNAIAVRMLNEYGYPNNVERFSHQNGKLEIWMCDGVELARMTVEQHDIPSFGFVVKTEFKG